MTFKEYYYKLDRLNRIEIKSQIIRRLEVPQNVFYSWFDANCTLFQPQKHQQLAIERITGISSDNLFPTKTRYNKNTKETTLFFN